MIQHLMLSLEISTQAINTDSGGRTFQMYHLLLIHWWYKYPELAMTEIVSVQYVFPKQHLVVGKSNYSACNRRDLNMWYHPLFRGILWGESCLVVRHIQYILEDAF